MLSRKLIAALVGLTLAAATSAASAAASQPTAAHHHIAARNAGTRIGTRIAKHRVHMAHRVTSRGKLAVHASGKRLVVAHGVKHTSRTHV
jgi:hypothetical protein